MASGSYERPCAGCLLYVIFHARRVSGRQRANAYIDVLLAPQDGGEETCEDIQRIRGYTKNYHHR